MSMSEYTPQRLKSAIIKADQLKATGAKTVVTSCHNCVDGLTDVIRHYKLGMKVTQLVNLTANALVIPEKVVVPVEVPIPAVALPLQGFKILVVDDEPDILTFLAAVLEDQGATVIQAADGEQALALTIQEKPDLMTLDLSMPGRNGGYVFEEIRNNPEIASTKVCIITGKPELRRLIYERPVAPPEGYLDKPVNEEYPVDQYPDDPGDETSPWERVRTRGKRYPMTDNPYKDYFEMMPAYLTILDRDLRIVEANRRFRRDFGDFEGRYCFQINQHRSERCEHCPAERTFRDGLRSRDRREIHQPAWE